MALITLLLWTFLETPRNNTRSRTGRSDQTGVVPNTREPPNRPWPPEPGVRVTPAAGAAPVPLTTPRESVPSADGTGEDIGYCSSAVKDCFQKSQNSW